MTEALLEEDPFEAFNRTMGAGTVRDPYPGFADDRRLAPVQPFDLAEEYGITEEMELDLPPGYRILGYDEVLTVLRDGETFSSAGYAKSMGELMGHSILEMDEPEHHSYRTLVQQAFTRKAMERWEADVVGADRSTGTSTSSSAAATPTWCASSRSRSRST